MRSWYEVSISSTYHMYSRLLALRRMNFTIKGAILQPLLYNKNS